MAARIDLAGRPTPSPLQGSSDPRRQRTLRGDRTPPVTMSHMPMPDVAPDRLPLLDVGAVNHVAINVRDLNRSTAFYSTVFGLQPVRRTGFRQVLTRGEVSVHLFQSPEPSIAAPPRNWRQLGLQHVAFSAPDGDLESIKDRLAQHGIHADGPVADADGRGLYLRDPDGIIIELRAPPERPAGDAAAPRSQP